MIYGFLTFLKSPLRYLKVKIPLISAIILIVVFASSSLLLIRSNYEREKQTLLSEARAFSSLATRPIGASYISFFESGYLKFRQDAIDVLELNTNIERVQIVLPDGEISFDSQTIDKPHTNQTKSRISEDLLEKLNSLEPVELRDSSGNIGRIAVPFFDEFGAKPFSIIYFLSYETVNNSVRGNVIATLALALAALLVSLIATTFLVYRSILNPLGKIVRAAKEISHDNLSTFIKLNTEDELGELATSLNQMTDKLKRNILDLKKLDKMKDEFIYLASHNLRTPLTVINGYLSRLKDSKTLSLEERKDLSNLEKGAKQLEDITESLLNLVNLEKEEDLTNKTRISLQEVLIKVIKVFESIANKENKKIKYSLEVTKPAFVEADSPKLSQVFSGLIDNALKFSKPKGEIVVTLEKQGAFVIVAIRDSGIGIPAEEQKYLFSKFHRATSTLTYDYKGLGLSLYLAKLIVASHGGKIWFESKIDKGSTFYIQLPLVK